MGQAERKAKRSLTIDTTSPGVLERLMRFSERRRAMKDGDRTRADRPMVASRGDTDGCPRRCQQFDLSGEPDADEPFPGAFLCRRSRPDLPAPVRASAERSRASNRRSRKTTGDPQRRESFEVFTCSRSAATLRPIERAARHGDDRAPGGGARQRLPRLRANWWIGIRTPWKGSEVGGARPTGRRLTFVAAGSCSWSPASSSQTVRAVGHGDASQSESRYARV